MFNVEQQRYFSEHLLEWYLENRRDLPWRRHSNPYYIWISEIMLQQTRVDTVIPYFNRFIERFPTIADLANAPEQDVLKCWEGLGYYSRARNLQYAAQQVLDLHGGQVPSDKESVLALKGVGPYTSGAILSIAYNQPEPAVDGNVMRVLSRYFLIEEDIMKGSTRTLMERLVVDLIPEGQASHFNQALMELGALVCTPKSPYCLTCPVMEHCDARIAGKELELPIKSKSKPPRPEQRIVGLIEGKGIHAGRILIRQRPESGLLARMWELPHFLSPITQKERLTDSYAQDILDKALLEEQIPAIPMEHFMDIEHIFSHIRWNLQVYHCEELASLLVAESNETYAVDSLEIGDPATEYRYINEQEMALYAFPNAFLKIINHFFESDGR
ncbi:A/G-specific adenine glycosylase [Paenibacillus sp. CMAA1364]